MISLIAFNAEMATIPQEDALQTGRTAEFETRERS